MATGWHIDDFILSPSSYARRREEAYEKLEIVKRLWAGEELSFPNGGGTERAVRLRPRPVQAHLPLWATVPVDPQGFREAAERGMNVLTANFGYNNDLEKLRPNIELYRSEMRRLQDRDGHVTLMMHVFVGDTKQQIEEIARPAMRRFLSLNIEMRAGNEAGRNAAYMSALDAKRRDVMVEHQTNENLGASSMSFIGTVDECRERAAMLGAAGTDEIACLIDFGVAVEPNLDSLRRLSGLIGEP